jgi:tRNA/tmRNA/rRNA uracil-C5-methylase (TrmA/RlmC/RlmD family)
VDDRGRVGFRSARRHDIVPTEHCLVCHPALDALLPGLRLHGADEIHLRVGATTGEATAWWRPERGASASGLPARVAVGPDAVLHEHVGGHRFQVSAASFFQTSHVGAEALVAAVRRAAGELAHTARRAIDAYAGVGLFAATVLGGGGGGLDNRASGGPIPGGGPGEVIAVESSRSSCADAARNLPDARIMCSAVERWRAPRAELVIADPARAGLGAAGVASLVAAQPERIVLVSCDPVSFARDARLLTDEGFALRRAEVLDLFPHTPHVEVVAAFDRR